LEPAVGRERSLALHRAFALDFLDTLGKVGRPVTVCFHPREALGAVKDWLGTGLDYSPQEGADLGQRMDHAFRKAFDSGENRVLAVGGDTPDLPACLLEQAFPALEENDVVLVPALDGGYACIGFARNTYRPGVFRGVSWGTSSVLRQTLDILASSGARVRLLDPWPDVDTPADLESLRVRLEARGACPRVRETLREGGMA
jgi:rSAM/selenodomain-associated transferase 1